MGGGEAEWTEEGEKGMVALKILDAHKELP